MCIYNVFSFPACNCRTHSIIQLFVYDVLRTCVPNVRGLPLSGETTHMTYKDKIIDAHTPDFHINFNVGRNVWRICLEPKLLSLTAKCAQHSGRCDF